jgi:hypothetical protein
MSKPEMSIIGTPYEALATKLPKMPLYDISEVIQKNWVPINFSAAPYVRAMSTLTSVKDNYYAESASSIILYFLSNASTFKGPVARLVKDELKRRIGVK